MSLLAEISKVHQQIAERNNDAFFDFCIVFFIPVEDFYLSEITDVKDYYKNAIAEIAQIEKFTGLPTMQLFFAGSPEKIEAEGVLPAECHSFSYQNVQFFFAFLKLSAQEHSLDFSIPQSKIELSPEGMGIIVHGKEDLLVKLSNEEWRLFILLWENKNTPVTATQIAQTLELNPEASIQNLLFKLKSKLYSKQVAACFEVESAFNRIEGKHTLKRQRNLLISRLGFTILNSQEIGKSAEAGSYMFEIL